MDLSKFVVRTNGAVDKAATLVAFNLALDAVIVKDAETTGKVGEAVNAVFDEYKGAAINMPALCGMVCTKLSADKDTFQDLSDAAKSYVQNNAQGDKDKTTGTVENPESLFVIAKGRGGGVRRRADITQEA
jgi:hypothetical protein